MLGIDNIKKALSSVLKLAITAIEVMEDKKISFTEWPRVGLALTQIPGLVKSGSDAIAELKDLTAEETAELSAYFKEEFDIDNDQLEARVEESIDLLLKTQALCMEWVQWGKSLKKEAV